MMIGLGWPLFKLPSDNGSMSRNRMACCRAVRMSGTVRSHQANPPRERRGVEQPPDDAAQSHRQMVERHQQHGHQGTVAELVLVGLPVVAIQSARPFSQSAPACAQVVYSVRL